MTDRAAILARLDQQFIWHPFTQMQDWLKQEPIVIVRGQGALLEDARGRTYLDANSSIWTNLQGIIIRRLMRPSNASFRKSRTPRLLDWPTSQLRCLQRNW